MKILITGGTGYIGRNLSRIFKKNKKYVVYSPSKLNLNLLDKYSILNVINDFNPDVIIHTAIIGGMRLECDSYDIIKYNVEMYENLMVCIKNNVIVFLIASGSEFDRRNDIDKIKEDELFKKYPVDPYGISKNIISRQALNDIRKNIFVLRLFGCFNYDEENSRFIKQCIYNIKNKKPIEIHQNKQMDFFYIDDVYTVINHILNNKKNILHSHINLVYYEKYDLIDIVKIILKSCKIKKYPIIIKNNNIGNSYTGDGSILKSMNLNLIGIKRGIQITCNKLL